MASAEAALALGCEDQGTVCAEIDYMEACLLRAACATATHPAAASDMKVYAVFFRDQNRVR